MPITVEPLTLSDFPTLQSHAASPHGDLAAPLAPVYFPVPDGAPEAVASRLRWSLAQQKYIFEHDSTARFVKAVDSESGEIVALARWHYYPNGWNSDSMTWLEANWEGGPKPVSELSADGMDPRAVAEGLNAEGWVKMLIAAADPRKAWKGAHGGSAYWVLCTLVTRPGFRKRGAGTQLVQWGLEQAAAGGEPAYLEAGNNGRPLYKKLGFEEIGQIDLTEVGMGRVTMLSHMKWEDKTSPKQA